MKDNFLDTNIIFSYSNYHESLKNSFPPVVIKCYLFIANKKEKFIVCGAVLEELSENIKKRARIHKAVIDKIQNPARYSFEKDSLVSFRDLPYAKKLYERFKNSNPEMAAYDFRLERRLSEIAIQKFLESDIDEKVIPIEQIDNELVNKIHDIISNHADCKILASALQLQSLDERKSFLFATADSNDFSPNNYAFLKEHFEINYSKENWKFPELLNLMFIS